MDKFDNLVENLINELQGPATPVSPYAPVVSTPAQTVGTYTAPGGYVAPSAPTTTYTARAIPAAGAAETSAAGTAARTAAGVARTAAGVAGAEILATALLGYIAADAANTAYQMIKTGDAWKKPQYSPQRSMTQSNPVYGFNQQQYKPGDVVGKTSPTPTPVAPPPPAEEPQPSETPQPSEPKKLPPVIPFRPVEPKPRTEPAPQPQQIPFRPVETPEPRTEPEPQPEPQTEPQQKNKIGLKPGISIPPGETTDQENAPKNEPAYRYNVGPRVPNETETTNKNLPPIVPPIPMAIPSDDQGVLGKKGKEEDWDYIPLGYGEKTPGGWASEEPGNLPSRDNISQSPYDQIKGVFGGRSTPQSISPKNLVGPAANIVKQWQQEPSDSSSTSFGNLFNKALDYKSSPTKKFVDDKDDEEDNN